MTQKQLILRYVEEQGSITPAKMSGVIYSGKMFGSEVSRRCRELREDDKLRSEAKGKFERYFINEIYQEKEVHDMPSTSQLEAKLRTLRELWMNQPDQRKIIELQARAIKSAIALKKTNMEFSHDPEVRRVAKALF